jgi:hypothetical protein
MPFDAAAPRVEQLGSPFGLRVTGILEFHPACYRAVTLVDATGEFADNAFEIALAGQLEKTHPSFVDVIHESHARFHTRQHVEQSALALIQHTKFCHGRAAQAEEQA